MFRQLKIYVLTEFFVIQFWDFLAMTLWSVKSARTWLYMAVQKKGQRLSSFLPSLFAIYSSLCCGSAQVQRWRS